VCRNYTCDKQRQVDEKCHPRGLCSFMVFGWGVSLCYTEEEEARLCSSGWIWKCYTSSVKNPTVFVPALLQCYADQDQRTPEPKFTILESDFLLYYLILSVPSPEVIGLLTILQI